jgi:hypothetical protein
MLTLAAQQHLTAQEMQTHQVPAEMRQHQQAHQIPAEHLTEAVIQPEHQIIPELQIIQPAHLIRQAAATPLPAADARIQQQEIQPAAAADLEIWKIPIIIINYCLKKSLLHEGIFLWQFFVD